MIVFRFVVLLTTVILILPVVAWRFFNVDVRPTLADKARLLQRSNRLKKKGESGIPRPFSGKNNLHNFRDVLKRIPEY